MPDLAQLLAEQLVATNMNCRMGISAPVSLMTFVGDDPIDLSATVAREIAICPAWQAHMEAVEKAKEALWVAREQFDVIATHADAISKHTAANVVTSSGDKIISDVWGVRNRARNTTADIDRVLKLLNGDETEKERD